MARAAPAWVYFIRRADGEGPIKIGCSSYVGTRLQQLTCWSPYPLAVLATTPGDETLERRLHCAFAGQHSHNEWFRPTADLLRIIDDVREGRFDADHLPDWSAENAIFKPSAQTRWLRGITIRLTYMIKWGYPVPEHVRSANKSFDDRDEYTAARSVVGAYVAEHYDTARAMRGRALRRAA